MLRYTLHIDGFILILLILFRCDIQTVALLVSRLPLALTTSPKSEYSIEGEWLTCYRNLLNRWKLYMERAYLDVELGKRYRQMRTHQAAVEAIARKTSGHSATNRPSESVKVVYPLPVCIIPALSIKIFLFLSD